MVFPLSRRGEIKEDGNGQLGWAEHQVSCEMYFCRGTDRADVRRSGGTKEFGVLQLGGVRANSFGQWP